MQKYDVVLSTLNCDETIGECLDAVADEIPVNKLIVVDGGSEDGTLDVIRGHSLWGRTDLFIRPDLSLGESRAFAFQHVETDVFVLVDSDVVIRSGWMDEMLRSLDDDVGVVEGGRHNHYVFATPKGNEMDRGLFGQNIIRKKAVQDIDLEDLDVLCREDNVTRFYVKKRGFRWVKNGCLLADHYSNPVRYDDTTTWNLRLGVNREILEEGGRADRIVKDYKRPLLLFLDAWYKPFMLWLDLLRKWVWYLVGWLKR